MFGKAADIYEVNVLFNMLSFSFLT